METQKNERQQADLSAMIELKMLETLDLRETDLEETEQERYDFLFETAKAENPGCMHLYNTYGGIGTNSRREKSITNR